MLNRFWKISALALIAGVGAPALLQAQSYSVDWFSVDGGGGTSSGGQFTVIGTVGQCDEVQMSGGQFTVDGSVWASLAAVQTSGSPMLRIQVTTTNTIIVAWPASSDGFTLQQNSNLGTTNWVNVPNAVNPVGGENQVIVSPAPGNNFYRLISQ
jgi:hypothetical protein